MLTPPFSAGLRAAQPSARQSCSENGKSILTDDLPAILGVDIDTANKAFMLLESLGMLEIDNGVIYVNYSGLFYENSKQAV